MIPDGHEEGLGPRQAFQPREQGFGESGQHGRSDLRSRDRIGVGQIPRILLENKR